MIKLYPHNSGNYQNTINWFKDRDLREAYGIRYQIDIVRHRSWLQRHNFIKLLSIYDNHRYVGNITLIARTSRLIELQIFVGDKRTRKRGVGKTATKLCISSIPKMCSIYVRCHPSLQKFYQRLGFVQSTSLLTAHCESRESHIYLFTKGHRNG